MDPETPANPRYNLRARKRKPEPPEPTSGAATTVYARRPTKRPRGATKVRDRRPVRVRPGEESSAVPAPAPAPAPAGEVKMQIQRRELPKERVVTWQHDGSLIEDPKFLPEGWDANEYDLYENDIDGNIERCHLRIRENILPKLFQERLERYMRQKAERDAIAAAAPGLPWNIARRLDDLRAIEQDLLKHDPQEQMSNARAIIAAYLNKELAWTKATVTFWSHGRKVWGPGKFDWKTFDTVNKAHEGHKSFWVEECNPGAQSLYSGWQGGPAGTCFMHHMRIHLRIPGITNPFATRVWDFIDDTGASYMGLFACDIAELEKAAEVRIQAFGHERVATANGNVSLPAYHLQARLLGNNDTLQLIAWTDIKVWISSGEPSDSIMRLSGIWPRHLLYFTNVPDNQGKVYMYDNKSELVEAMPDVDASQAIPPRWDFIEHPVDEGEMDLTAG